MEGNKIEKVAIYTRVSTLQQVEEGFSLDAQKDRLIKLAESNNYKIYKIYEEFGKSGKNTNRPAFQEMMVDMRAKKFNRILVMKLDRISRSVADLEQIIAELQKNKCGFESASEKIDTTSAMGMMFIRLLGIFAQFERERISERIKDVFADKIQKGGAITGNLPIGYKVGLNENKEKIVVKDLEKEEFVNAIFDTYEKTSSLIKTAMYLNNKYSNLVYKGGFNTIDLKRIMQNTMYYGCLKGNKNYCEPYLSYERWKKINDMRENKNLKSPRVNTFIFSGLLYGECGHKLAGTTHLTSKINKTKKYAYRCSKYAHSGGCKNNNINEDVIEEAVLKMLPDCINDFLKEKEIEYRHLNDEIDLEKEKKRLNEDKKRIINSYMKGWISEEEAEKEISFVDEELKKYNTVTEKKDYSYIENLLQKDIINLYNNLNRENKRLFFRSFIDHIVVDVVKYRNGKENFLEIFIKD